MCKNNLGYCVLGGTSERAFTLKVGKYRWTVDLLFHLIGFRCFAHVDLHALSNPNWSNWRSAVHCDTSPYGSKWVICGSSLCVYELQFCSLPGLRGRTLQTRTRRKWRQLETENEDYWYYAIDRSDATKNDASKTTSRIRLFVKTTRLFSTMKASSCLIQRHLLDDVMFKRHLLDDVMFKRH